VKRGKEELRSLTWRWFRRRRRGSEGPNWETKVIDSPCGLVLVRGRKRVYDNVRRYGDFVDRFWREGLEEVDESVREEDKSSPRRHWPQKAMLAAAATAASRGSRRLRASIRDNNMVVLTGGRGGRREESGVRFLTPFKTKFSRKPPFQSTLCKMCQALRAEMYLHTVSPDI